MREKVAVVCLINFVIIVIPSLLLHYSYDLKWTFLPKKCDPSGREKPSFDGICRGPTTLTSGPTHSFILCVALRPKYGWFLNAEEK